MQENRNQPAPASPAGAPCRHLRSKEMYYQPYAAPEDEFSSGVYWCGKTLENYGPDGEPCSRGQCRAQRACFLD